MVEVKLDDSDLFAKRKLDSEDKLIRLLREDIDNFRESWPSFVDMNLLPQSCQSLSSLVRRNLVVVGWSKRNAPFTRKGTNPLSTETETDKTPYQRQAFSCFKLINAAVRILDTTRMKQVA